MNVTCKIESYCKNICNVKFISKQHKLTQVTEKFFKNEQVYLKYQEQKSDYLKKQFHKKKMSHHKFRMLSFNENDYAPSRSMSLKYESDQVGIKPLNCDTEGGLPCMRHNHTIKQKLKKFNTVNFDSVYQPDSEMSDELFCDLIL